MNKKTKYIGSGLIVIGLIAFSIYLIHGFREVFQGKTNHAIQGEIGAVRSAIRLYRDEAGHYPPTFQEFLPKYWPPNSSPKLWWVGKYPHEMTKDCLVLKVPAMNDTGKWVYIFNPGAEGHGTVYIDCSHLDSKGKPFNKY